jgi:DNA recombination protein RmuC
MNDGAVLSIELSQILLVVAGALVSLLVTYVVMRRRVDELRERLAHASRELETTRGELDAREVALEEARDARSALATELAEFRTRAAHAERAVDEQRAFLEASRGEMENAFGALAARALSGNTDQFLKMAERQWSATRAQAEKELDLRKQAVESLVSPLQDVLKRLDERTGEIEKVRAGAYAKLDEHIRLLAEQTTALQRQTTSLDTALRGTQTQGRWGEIALRNVAELAGMSEHCDFVAQQTTDNGRRPDMTVRLPGGDFIAVDAKAPVTAYLEAMETADPVKRDAALKRHVAALRAHVKSLDARAYSEQLEGTVDLVVMFLPGDPFLAEAFRMDPNLQVEALRSRVLIATPSTLVALLRTVAIYWQQRAMAENAREIAAVARELYARSAKFGEDLSKVRKGLLAALGGYNDAVGSFERRFMPMGKRLEELKVSEGEKRELIAPEPIDDEPRPIGDQLRLR